MGHIVTLLKQIRVQIGLIITITVIIRINGIAASQQQNIFDQVFQGGTFDRSQLSGFPLKALQLFKKEKKQFQL